MDFKIIKKGFFIAFTVLFIGVFCGKAFLLHKKKRRLDIACEIGHQPIYVIILSDDERVLESAISQDYDNFKIFHLTKNTKQLTFNKKLQKLPIDPWLSKKENISKVISKLHPNDIVVMLDERRWFAHSHVLSKLANIFKQSNVSAVVAKKITYPNYELLNEDISDLACRLAKNFSNSKIEKSARIHDVLFMTTEGKLN